MVAPDKIRVGDIAHVRKAEGRIYLATAIDLFNRQAAGSAKGERIGAQLVVDGLPG